MSTLHTVNKSPFENRSLESCLAHARAGDAVILIEDGVYGGLAGTALAPKVAARIAEVKLYVLRPDAEARGLGQGRMLEGVGSVDYGGFVDLVAEHDRTQAWL